MEALPDLGTLSDDDLKALIEKLEHEENEVSYRRRLLQGRIDILRAERTARLKGKAAARRRHRAPHRHPLLPRHLEPDAGRGLRWQ